MGIFYQNPNYVGMKVWRVGSITVEEFDKIMSCYNMVMSYLRVHFCFCTLLMNVGEQLLHT